jgi:probable rRNA maturation factor
VPADFGRRAIERFARRLEVEVAQGCPFDCLIADDAELRRLNREFLGEDYPTDVLAFPAPGPTRESRGYPARLGDIAISFPRARAQARAFGHDTGQEIQVLMLHGLLHLLGMDHTTDGGRMARVEKRWRARLGLPDGLIERVRA